MIGKKFLERFDLVLTDKHLADMMGENILEIMAENKKHKNTSKTVLTAFRRQYD